MIGILKDSKGFKKSVELRWPMPEYRLPVFKRAQWSEETLSAPTTSYITFLRRDEIAPGIWEYEEL